MTRIYLSAPHMSGHEQEFVAEAFRTNWLSSIGPNVDAFEAEFGERIGLPSVALSSGTAAMHLALRLLGVGPGDDVVCPTFTFVATANPIVYVGGRPVFVDSERISWNLDPNVLEDALRRRSRPPKAVIVVHLFGQSADLDAIVSVCDRYGTPLQCGLVRYHCVYAREQGGDREGCDIGVGAAGGDREPDLRQADAGVLNRWQIRRQGAGDARPLLRRP